jgi:hypothetical protein
MSSPMPLLLDISHLFPTLVKENRRKREERGRGRRKEEAKKTEKVDHLFLENVFETKDP